jgi:hypothetical protein
MSRWSRVLTIACALFVTTFLVPGIPTAQAHGDCNLDGNIFWSTAGPSVLSIWGQGKWNCGSSQHYSSSGIVRLQWKNANGTWITVASSGDVQACCSKSTYTITTQVGNCLLNPNGPSYQWRTRVGYWHLWNVDGKIAHKVYNTTIKSGSMKCKP